MLYNNLIYFIVVIFIMASNSVPDHPSVPFALGIGLFVAKLVLFRFVIAKLLFNRSVRQPASYARAERNGTILAIICFGIDIYLLDGQFYFAKLPFVKQLPVLIDFSGVFLFATYLAIMWGGLTGVYKKVFSRSYSPRAFIVNNIRTNVVIILPWLFLSLLANLISAAPLPAVHHFLLSSWGETFSSLASLAVMVFVLPFLLTRLWQCTPLPQGAHRSFIADLCRKQQVTYNDILIWPLQEGQALTAGVVGFVKKCRYILVTPALLRELSPQELEAVISHEIGHVKKRHLQLYLVVFLGFAFFLQFSSGPLISALSDSDLFYKMVDLSGKNPGDLLTLISTGPVFVLMVVYFRYILGYFMRNFERQADLYALGVMQSAAPLVQVFEKIAWLGGNIRDQPCWHHFSLGQRIDFLKKSERDPEEISKHNRRVFVSLITLLVVIVCGSLLLWKIPPPSHESVQGKYAVAVIKNMIKDDPQNALLYQGLADLQYNRKMYAEAMDSYGESLRIAPGNAEVLNSLAWLLLTVEDNLLADYSKGLLLAKRAFINSPQAHILDTLALAYWLNGSLDQAILAEKRAIAQEPENIEYYQKQLEKYQNRAISR